MCIAYKFKMMDAHYRKSFFLLAIVVVFIRCSSFTVNAGIKAEQLESVLIEEMEDVLPHSSFSNGIDEVGEIIEVDEPWQMVQKKGNQFVVNDQPFYVSGFNTYWLMVFAADNSTRGKVSEVFKEASSVGECKSRFGLASWRTCVARIHDT